MDKSKHTVTIPIADYEELLAAKSVSNESANIKFLKAHFDLLKHEGIDFHTSLRFDKMPHACIVQPIHTMLDKTKYVIHFKYL